MKRHDAANISVEDLNALLEAHADMCLLDVLPSEHFRKIHIPGAQNACVFKVTFLDDLAAVVADKRAKIVVYGSSRRSHDAATAVEKLTGAGYQDVYGLTGGLEAWREAGYRCEGEAPDQEIDPQTQLSLADGRFLVDRSQSVIQWQGRNAGSSHYGEVDIIHGSIDCDNGAISGRIEVDMQSIRNINLAGDELQPVLEAHLASDDFFFTSMFPRAVLTIEAATPREPAWQTSPNFDVRAILQLRGVNAPLDFEATVNLADENTLTLEAHFDIDRTRWKILYGSARFFEHLGMHRVFDVISLQMRLTAVP